MTVKERLHQLVDDLDESRVEAALALLTNLASASGQSEEDDGYDEEDLLADAPPFTFDSPLWDIVGMIDSGPDGPRDVSRNIDEYLAKAYADLHGDEE